MMDDLTIYHNPRCSKSRQTLELIRERGFEPVVIEYLNQPPEPALVLKLAKLLGYEPHQLLRTKEPAYARHQLSESSSAKRVAEAIFQDPVLLERPIVVRADRAIMGRPPENVLALLD